LLTEKQKAQTVPFIKSLMQSIRESQEVKKLLLEIKEQVETAKENEQKS
jgi:alpha-D-ribose 1-methylphosphonate 5-triphosphate synthase subunit PhnG